MKKLLLLSVLLLLCVAPLSAQTTEALPWWNDRVFYEIFVRSFYDSDGDGIGDLQGVIEKLDYLNDGDPTTTTDLGVTGIWLMPVTQSPSYHGYDVIDYRTIEEDYGTNEDFRALMAAAHERGIAVIVDFVANHTSVQHPWFVASANNDPQYAGWYIWRPFDPNYNGPWNQEVWHPMNGRWYYGVFWSGMPDLNYGTQAVTDEIYDAARFWLEDMGVDGFRVDALRHLVEEGRTQADTESSIAWGRDFNDYITSVNPDSLMVGEVWTSRYIASNFYEAGSADLVFEFDLATALVDSASAGTGTAISSMQGMVNDLYPNGQYAAFLTNHDQNRVMSELRGNVDAARVAAALLLTNPGVPFLYYGEEIGMQGVKPDERIRTPMQWDATRSTAGFTTDDHPWQPLQNDYEEVNVAAQTGDPASLLSTYRDLIRLRNEHVALRQGEYIAVDSGSRAVYAFLRQHADETVLVVINLSDDPVTDYALSLRRGTLGEVEDEVIFGEGDAAALIANAEGGFDSYVPLPELAPYSTIVIRLTPVG
ncbi:MAG: alpha-glucosidase C-terminal domain-containing protein [Anaerolinea sp.]|nr:alpha-glucosidase C-terminal domain-containing protein [Anaerolinea sp.]